MNREPKEYYDELYDSIEMGLNRQFRVVFNTAGNTISDKLEAARKLEESLPLRSRSLETIKKQQFSTPLTLATAGSFIEYKRHNTLKVVSKHPSVVVESQELAAVNPPPITYQPGKKLSDSYREGHISDEQMDVILLAMQAVSRGRGFIIADDVGVGKTREMAGIVLEMMDSGKFNRILYVCSPRAWG